MLMVQIYVVQLRYTEAMDILIPALENNSQNADLLYTLSQIFRIQGDMENYEKALESALANHQSLTLPFEKVQIEYSKIKAQMDELRSQQTKDVEEEFIDQQEDESGYSDGLDNNQEEPISEERFEDDELQTEDNYEDDEDIPDGNFSVQDVLDE